MLKKIFNYKSIKPIACLVNNSLLNTSLDKVQSSFTYLSEKSSKDSSEVVSLVLSILGLAECAYKKVSGIVLLGLDILGFDSHSYKKIIIKESIKEPQIEQYMSIIETLKTLDKYILDQTQIFSSEYISKAQKYVINALYNLPEYRSLALRISRDKILSIYESLKDIIASLFGYSESSPLKSEIMNGEFRVIC